MQTRTRLLTVSDTQALAELEPAIMRSHKKVKTDPLPNGLRFTTRLALMKATCEAAVNNGVLTFSAKDAAQLGASIKVVDQLDQIINDQGWAAARTSATAKLFADGVLKMHVLDTLTNNETIQAVTTGTQDGKLTALVATDARILLIKIGALSSAATVIGLKNMTSISSEKHFATQSVKITTSNAELEVEKVLAGTADEFVATVQNMMANTTQPAPQAASVGIQDLTQLAELHRAGALTDEEFAAAKAKALGL